MDSQNDTATPALQLVGKELPNGWKVIESVNRSEHATGGRFSISYIVQSVDGDKAFLKAMDYRKALESPDPARALQHMTAAYNFERDILEKCKSYRLSRIVRVLDSGKLPPQDGDLSSVVEYLIFECARGDIRSFVTFNKNFDKAWALRTIHQTAVALHQLHSAEMAHQDLKPSNLLIFEDDRLKLADLGRAFDRYNSAPHDELTCAGDPTYAPPELLYGHAPENWQIRRFGCDLYLLGSLIVFFYTGTSMTHLLFMRLHENHFFDKWKGTLYSEVLPYLDRAFAEIIREFRTNFGDDITDMVKQLCNPDPRLRGHPKNFQSEGNKYSLERYISALDLLARKAEWSLKGREPIRRTN